MDFIYQHWRFWWGKKTLFATNILIWRFLLLVRFMLITVWKHDV